MTEQELGKHRKWCMFKYGDDGDDIYREAYTIALEQYGDIEKVNQSLFGFLCRWAARDLLAYHKHEIPFSCLMQENADQTDEIPFEPMDSTWEKDFVAIEEREEVVKKYGQCFLNALLSVATESKPSKVTLDCEKEEQLQFEFV